MTARRCFYTDPLAAAWMNFRHGFKFMTAEGELLLLLAKDCTFYGYEGAWVNPHESAHQISAEFPAYVHPDSVMLLEPREGDVLLNPDDRAATVVVVKKPADYHSVMWSQAKEFVADGSASIISRGGKVFHWPESEVA